MPEGIVALYETGIGQPDARDSSKRKNDFERFPDTSAEIAMIDSTEFQGLSRREEKRTKRDGSLGGSANRRRRRRNSYYSIRCAVPRRVLVFRDLVLIETLSEDAESCRVFSVDAERVLIG